MIEIKEDSIILTVKKNKFDLPFLWLRDNCQCDECRITETQEKQFLLHSVPVDIVPEHVEEIENNIKIIWPDGHESFIPIDLIKNSYAALLSTEESSLLFNSYAAIKPS